MNKYSKRSQENINSCHKLLRLLFNSILPVRDHTVICGHRGEEPQNRAFIEGRSKVKYPNGKHNGYPSMATDVAPYFPNTDLFIPLNCAYFAGYVMGVAQAYKIPLRWGGDWDKDGNNADQNFNDLVHFELTCSKEEADEIYSKLTK